ncbi:hypothetical protein BJ742DRAFT_736651 [Cladochytrium replicatum]|nr:hypothetical protein BJ742DRAFT_736651 [Cladochytrium replicatum]
MYASTALTRRNSSHTQYQFTSGSSINGTALADPYSHANGHSYSGQHSPQHHPKEKDRYLQPFLLHSLGAADSSSSTIPIPSASGVSTSDYTGSPRGLRRTPSSGSSPVWSHARTRSRSPGGLGSPRLYGSPDEYGTEYGSSAPRDSRHLGDDLPPTQRLEELNVPVLSFGTPAMGNAGALNGSSNGWSRSNDVPPSSSTSRRSLFWDSNSPTELSTKFPPSRSQSSVSQPNCAVTVIGIMPHVSSSIASHFRSLGEVVSLQLPPSGNWMNVVYANEAGARLALGEHRRIFDDCMISVEINTSHNSNLNGSSTSSNNKPLNGKRESTDSGPSPSPIANGFTRSVLKRPRSFLDTSTADSSSSPVRRKVQQNGDSVESVGVMRSSTLERNGSVSQSSTAPRKPQVVQGGVKSTGRSGLWESLSSVFTNW